MKNFTTLSYILVYLHTCIIADSTSGISTVCKDGLTSNPSTLRAQESNDWRNILHHSQTVTHAIRLVELNSFG